MASLVRAKKRREFERYRVWCPRVMMCFVGLVVLSLTACSITMDDLAGLTPREQVYILKKDYDAKLDVALDYARQPPCDNLRVVGCSDREIVVVLYRVATAADRALDIALLSANPTDIDTARVAYQTLVNELVRAQLLEVTQ